ncbi:hypothetical protein BGW39_009629 [Mortierella sp. 14UC]|nr:hypothetical protein BGW39_009629 [Mortierella sp. 14UC]
MSIHGDGCAIGLSLAQAVEHEWVCKEIQALDIDVAITGDGMNPAYMADTSKATWTKGNRRHWDDLGELYEQVGSLTNLQVLNLYAVECSPHGTEMSFNRDHQLSPMDTCLPGLLALQNSSSFTGQQIGHLDKFAGL